MIFLILSEEGFAEIQEVADKSLAMLWLNKGIINADALELAKEQQWHIYVFSEYINPHSENAIIKAIKYIEKKYPDEAIEVEYY